MNNKKVDRLARVHVIISGLVQGVFFRAETKYNAQRLNLSGWVKNLPDGNVEAVFQGDRSAVEEILEWCRRGPSGAIVKDVQIEWQECLGEEKGFYIR